MFDQTQTARDRAPKITVVTTMKDEGPYILDWIAHYRSLGVTDFVVFTNDCSDPTDHILRCLNRLGCVHHRFNRVMRRGPHKSALMWAQYEPAVREADWVMVIDVDEYLKIDVGDGTLPGLIKMYPEVDAISFVWRVFGNAGIQEITDTPVPLQFTKAIAHEGAATENRFFKTLHRNSPKFARLGVHRPFLADGPKGINWILPDGTSLTEEEIEKALFAVGHYGYAGAQLNHYALRSLDGFLVKKLRGRANHHTKTIEDGYWRRFDHNVEDDLSLAENFDAAMQIRERFLRIEDLRKWHEEALDLHRKRARQARKDPDILAMLEKLQHEQTA